MATADRQSRMVQSHEREAGKAFFWNRGLTIRRFKRSFKTAVYTLSGMILVTESLADSTDSRQTANSVEKETNTRTRLLSAAGPVFAERGFAGATVREICAAAEVNIASVGYHFRDKMGLYREVIQGIRDSRAKRFPEPDNDGIDPQRSLYLLVKTLLSRMLAPGALDWETQLLMREMQNPTPVFESIVREFFRPLFDRLVEVFRLLLGQNAPKQVLERLAFSTVGQCLYYRVGRGVVQILIPEDQRQQHYDIESLGQQITATMLAATENAAVLEKQKEIERWTK